MESKIVEDLLKNLQGGVWNEQLRWTAEKWDFRKNKLINYFNQKHDVNKSKIKSIEIELDSLLYKYYKTLRTGISRGF